MNSLSTKRFSIKTLLLKQNDFKRPVVCSHLYKFSQLIRDRTGSGESYIDSHLKCNHLQIRITKKHCKNCNFYNPIKAD